MVSIFVGSSSEQMETALEVCKWIEDTNNDAVLWRDIFDLGDQTISKLVEVAGEVDGAILIFGKDDEIWYRGDKGSSPRDNVIFEFGLFSGRFGGFSEKRAIVIRMEDTKMPSDLAGFTYAAFNNSRKKNSEIGVKKWAKSLTKRDTIDTGIKIYAMQKKALFLQGTELIRRADIRVKLFAKTPVPLVGPRPYDVETASQYAYESEQFNAYWNIIERASDGHLHCGIGCSVTCLSDEIVINSSLFKKNVSDRIDRIYELVKKTGSNLNIYWTFDRNPSTFVVGDSESLIWFKGNNSDNVWVRDRSVDLADALATTIWRTLSIDEVKKHLGI